MSSAPRIHVHGGDIVALCAAIAFRRALPGAQVLLIGDPEPPQRYGAAGPELAEFHRKIGLEERMFEKAVQPVETRASRFENWGKNRLSFDVPVQGKEPYVDGAALHQLWLRRESSARPCPCADLLDDREGPPGVRFDAARYAQLLSRMAQAIGIGRTNSESDDAATLVLDCRQRSDTVWDDWSRYLPSFDETQVRGSAATDCATERVTCADGHLHLAIGGLVADFSPSDRTAGRIAQPWTGRRIALGRGAIELTPCTRAAAVDRPFRYPARGPLRSAARRAGRGARRI